MTASTTAFNRPRRVTRPIHPAFPPRRRAAAASRASNPGRPFLDCALPFPCLFTALSLSVQCPFLVCSLPFLVCSLPFPCWGPQHALLQGVRDVRPECHVRHPAALHLRPHMENPYCSCRLTHAEQASHGLPLQLPWRIRTAAVG